MRSNYVRKLPILLIKCLRLKRANLPSLQRNLLNENSNELTFEDETGEELEERKI